MVNVEMAKAGHTERGLLRKRVIGRFEGITMLGVYAGYIYYLIIR